MQYKDKNISPLKAFFRNKWVRVILAINFITVLTIIAISIWQSTKISAINFNIAPVDATISVNGNTNYTNGQYKITPGTYEIKISREGLESKTLSVNIEPHYIVNINVFLADSDHNFKFYELKDNYESYRKLKSIASSENNVTNDQDTSAEQFISDFEYKLSILEILPIKDFIYAEPSVKASTAGFTIKDGRNKKECEKTTCLLVNYYGKDFEKTVMRKIEEAGYNSADYQIFYERYN